MQEIKKLQKSRRRSMDLRRKLFVKIMRAKLEELERLEEQRKNEERVRRMAQRFKEAQLQRQNNGIHVSFLYRRPGQSINEFQQAQKENQAPSSHMSSASHSKKRTRNSESHEVNSEDCCSCCSSSSKRAKREE